MYVIAIYSANTIDFFFQFAIIQIVEQVYIRDTNHASVYERHTSAFLITLN